MSPKEINLEIKRLKKIKKELRAGIKERLNVVHKIKELQKSLSSQKEIDKEKEPLITEILKLDNWSKYQELEKFSAEELKKHLLKIKGGNRCLK